MIMIGEKINGVIPSVGKAINEKDINTIKELAVRQAEAGADYIDVCAGTEVEVEEETLNWLIDIVQSVTETPICIDSPNPVMLKTVLPRINKPGLINSVSMEGDKCDIIFPIARERGFGVIGLAMDNNGIPKTGQERIDIAKRIISKADEYEFSVSNLYIDPLVIAISTDDESFNNFASVSKALKEEYPEIHITSGMSNISFGMPLRKKINRSFLSLAMYVGMDSAILDPLDKDILSTILIGEALTGNDRHCRKFLKAYRKGLI